MDGRPSKRQRRLVVSSSGDEADSQGEGVRDPRLSPPAAVTAPATASSSAALRSSHGLSVSNSASVALRSPRSKTNPRARPGQQAPADRSAVASSPSPRKKNRGRSSPRETTKSKSLHSFFQPASEGQRWSSQKFEIKPTPDPIPEETVDADAIEDDYDSYDEIFTQHLNGGTPGLPDDTVPTRENRSQTRGPTSKQTSKRSTTHISKRFLMPTSSGTSTTKRTLAGNSPAALDPRPWAQRFAPSNLSELAVHKKKVSDVQNWLEDVFAGRRNERLLVLRGPAGCGKTTTISLLSESLGFDIIEWKNPPVSEFTAREAVSVSAQFEEFLGRGDKFAGLDLESATKDHAEKESRSAPPSASRILLVEEFPAMGRASSGLTAFRDSLQRHLAASVLPSAGSAGEGGLTHPPIVIIVSETLLSSASSISDNLTVHRLLGPTIFNHPGTTIIDFNRIAPTYMHKALRSILEKEARDSKRTHIPGPGVLDRVSEIGDIRSAVSALEFLCLKGDRAGTWGGNLATKTKKSSRGDVALTSMEQESLKLITQRQASLGMFHAVGKIVYNKREDRSLAQDQAALPAPPPEHLSHHRRDKISQVAVNELVDETGTDIPTFICALHENYPPSCDGPSFTDCLNACMEALSDSDLLGVDRRPGQSTRAGIGIGATHFSGGVDMLRQDEISFQVAARGLLFALPYPVHRRLALPGKGRARAGDAYKMYYPASLRLWKKAEEIEGLVDTWMTQSLHPSGAPHWPNRAAELTGVTAWRRAGRAASDPTLTPTMLSRHEVLLYQLPYMAQMGQYGWDPAQLENITAFRATNPDSLRDDDDMDDLEDSVAPSAPQSRMQAPRLSASTLQEKEKEEEKEEEEKEEKLILSDDDIVDD